MPSACFWLAVVATAAAAAVSLVAAQSTFCSPAVDFVRANGLQCLRQNSCTNTTVETDCTLPPYPPPCYIAACVNRTCQFSFDQQCLNAQEAAAAAANGSTTPAPSVSSASAQNITVPSLTDTSRCYGQRVDPTTNTTYCYIGICVVDVGCAEYFNGALEYRFPCDCQSSLYLQCSDDPTVCQQVDVAAGDPYHHCQRTLCVPPPPTTTPSTATLAPAMCQTYRALPPMPVGCCQSADDCDDGNACAIASCSNATALPTCVYAPLLTQSGCCASSADCVGAPAQLPACGPDVCPIGECMTTPAGPVCNGTERCVGTTFSYCAVDAQPVPLSVMYACPNGVLDIGVRCRLPGVVQGTCVYGTCQGNATAGVLCVPNQNPALPNATFLCDCTCGPVFTESLVCGAPGTEYAFQCVPPDAANPPAGGGAGETCSNNGDTVIYWLYLVALIAAMLLAVAYIVILVWPDVFHRWRVNQKRAKQEDVDEDEAPRRAPPPSSAAPPAADTSTRGSVIHRGRIRM
jgi:hypothetical protein